MLQWLCTLLTVLFVAAKLTGHIAWGWLAVLSPAFVYLGFVLLLFMAVHALQANIERDLRTRAAAWRAEVAKRKDGVQ